MASRKNNLLGTEIWCRARSFLVVLPGLIIVSALVIMPAIYIAWMSLHRIRLADIRNGIGGPLTLFNYDAAISSGAVMDALWMTVYYVFASTAGAFVIGLAAALALNDRFGGAGWLRTLICSPWVIAPVMASLVWSFMLDQNFGLVNYGLLSLGLISQPVGWLQSIDAARFSVVLVSIWKSFPFFTIMLLAALQSVADDLYDAASLDGAGRIARFVDITLPGIAPAAAIAFIFSALTSFREVETILILTKGGPARGTETIAVKAYQEAFEYGYDFGESAAIGSIGLGLVLMIALVALAVSRKRSTH